MSPPTSRRASPPSRFDETVSRYAAPLGARLATEAIILD